MRPMRGLSARLFPIRKVSSSIGSGGGPYHFPANQFNRVERFILVRHGESLGNVDEATYVDSADWRIPLTPRGHEQAEEAGRAIRTLLGREGTVFFYVSPYRRTRQTLQGILSQLDLAKVVGVREEPRLVEQQFGNFQDVAAVRAAKEQRRKYGRFFYRFPDGEAGLDVYNRATSFIATVIRHCAQLRAEGHDMSRTNLCIVTHGLTLRLFLMRWFQFSVEEFEASWNPCNGRVIVLERHTNAETGRQWFELTQDSLDHLGLPSYYDQDRWKVLDGSCPGKQAGAYFGGACSKGNGLE